MGGGPSGLPLLIDDRAISNFGLLAILALLPLFSRAPPRIHWRMVSTFSAGIMADFGGMKGSCLWDTSSNNRLASGSAGLMTSPELPPAMMPA